MSYLMKVQDIDASRVIGTRSPQPIRAEVNLGGDTLLQGAIGKKAGLRRRILALLVKVLSSPAGDQGGWEGGARGL